MSLTPPPADRRERVHGGIDLLLAVVLVMWVVEIINAIDSQQLNADGIHPRDLGRIWAIFTAPFLHAGFGHLIANTIPLLFLGVIIALRGAGRVAMVTAIVIIVGGLGTWLIAPSGSVTIGASGVVFGYATYLLSRGVFDRSLLELLTGLLVGILWGGALLASLIPQYGISWQGHLCGAIAGVVAARMLARSGGSSAPEAGPGSLGSPRGSRLRDRSAARLPVR